MLESDKIMFQVYREGSYNRKYRVVYFTELHDHNREIEINRALAGEAFFEGFIRNFKKDQAKQIIENTSVLFMGQKATQWISASASRHHFHTSSFYRKSVRTGSFKQPLELLHKSSMAILKTSWLY